MPGKRRRPAPRRKARPSRKHNRVVLSSRSHHELNPGAWMPQVSMPRYLSSGRTFQPLDYYEEG